MIEQKYKNRYYLNGINIYDRWGIIIERGGYEELTRKAQRKEQYSRVWGDENGTQRYVGTTLLDSKTMTLPFTFLCSGLADYLQKSKDFFDYIMSVGYFNLYSDTLGIEWRLLYNAVSSVEDKTDMYRGGGVVIATHNLVLVDDFLSEGGEQDYRSVALLWSDTDNVEYLFADDVNIFIGEF